MRLWRQLPQFFVTNCILCFWLCRNLRLMTFFAYKQPIASRSRTFLSSSWVRFIVSRGNLKRQHMEHSTTALWHSVKCIWSNCFRFANPLNLINNFCFLEWKKSYILETVKKFSYGWNEKNSKSTQNCSTATILRLKLLRLALDLQPVRRKLGIGHSSE